MEKFANRRIKAEYDRLLALFSSIDEKQMAVAKPLIKNAAFMKVTLDGMQAAVATDGVIDQYQNGENQKGYKQSANIQAYNALVKNYAQVNKMLFALLPKGAPESRLKSFMNEDDE